MKTSRRLIFWIGAVAGISGALIFGVLLFLVDDWSRDLTQNFAELDKSSNDPFLRPLESDQVDKETLSELVLQFSEHAPQWQLVEQTTESESIRIHLTRTTPRMQFVDDIHVTIAPAVGMVRLNATSQSRVGKGDLGQNPRNLKELTGWIAESITNARPQQSPSS